MKIIRKIDISHLTWDSIGSHPKEITIDFKTGDSLTISWEQAKLLATWLDEKRNKKV